MSALPTTAKAIAIAASAALLSASPAVAASVPLAKPATHPSSHAFHSHPARPGHGGHSRPVHVDKLAGARRGTTHAIAAQLRWVTMLMNQAGSTGSDAAALQSALTADRAAIQADSAAVATAPDRRALTSLLRAAVYTRQVAGIQFRNVAALDAVAATIDGDRTTLASLQDELTSAGDTIDVTSSQSDVDDATSALDGLEPSVSDAVAGILALKPAASFADVRAAVQPAHATLDAAQAVLDQAQADIDAVEVALGFLPPSGN